MPAYSEIDPVMGYDSVSTENPKNFKMPKWDVEDDIVISGLSGRFPESDSIEEFEKYLYDGVDLVTEDARRWEIGLLGIPSRHGKLKDITKFDADFFGVEADQAELMDPQQRLLLEVVYEAIVDAGYSAHSIRGKNIGVFIGMSFYETFTVLAGKPEKANGLAALGCATFWAANRISYSFDLTGPSVTLDTACSSSIHALQQAVLCLRSGQCEAAIVGGTNITLGPVVSLQFHKLGMICADGKCKAFDAAADGYVRAETVSALLLQKSKDARRVYATVIHAKLNEDGAKTKGITFPDGRIQKRLLEEIYGEAEIDPRDIVYLEAHGTGTKIGDVEELEAVTDFFCKERAKPLYIGSVKSNMGHSESSSGMSSLSKVIIALENGLIPPNLHFKTPNPNIKGLFTGQLKVVTEPFPLEPGSLVGINSFGFGGANAHVILKGNLGNNVQRRVSGQIPRLALCCGRTNDAVEYALNKIIKENYPEEAIVLLGEACNAPTMGMPYRGYALINSIAEESTIHVHNAPLDVKPVWFFFTGGGSEWPEVAKDMMKIEQFADSIQRSAKILKPYGIDLVKMISRCTDEDLTRVAVSFVAITSIQVALVDVLRDLSVRPDGVIGVSSGELVCAYADGGLDAEETIMAAYWSGICREEADLVDESMVVTGLSWEAAKRRCPDSMTILGPADDVQQFVLTHVPQNSIAIEISPDSRLEVNSDCGYVSLMSGNHTDNVMNFLSSIGKLYNLGLNPTLKNLYPSVSFPVPRGTPNISHLVKWDHSRSWRTVSSEDFLRNFKSHDGVVNVDCYRQDSPDFFMIEHKIDGRALYPAAGFILLAWKALEKQKLFIFDETPVVLENVTIHRATVIPNDGKVSFKVNLMKTSGQFEIREGGSMVCSGRIYVPSNANFDLERQIKKRPLTSENKGTEFVLDGKDIYKELRLRGYEYGPSFQCLVRTESDFLNGKVRWNGNWVTFMDSLTHIFLLNLKTRLLNLPTRFETIRIDPRKQPNPSDTCEISLYYDPYINALALGGIEYEGIKVTNARRHQTPHRSLILEEYHFVPNIDENVLNKMEFKKLEEYIGVCSSLTEKILRVCAICPTEIGILTTDLNTPSRELIIDHGRSNYVLLNTLKDILDETVSRGGSASLESIVSNAIAQRTQGRYDDVLSTSLLNEKSLRSMIDFVIENVSNSKNIRIMEVATCQSISQYLLGLVKTYHSFIHAEYTVGKIEGKSSLDLDTLDDCIKKTELDLESELHTSESYDLVVTTYLCGTVGNGPSFKSFLRRITESVKDNGFILLLERTRSTPGEMLLSMVNPKQSLVIREGVLEDICEAIGLSLVSKKSDAITSTFYLMRKCKTLVTTEEPTVIIVDNENYDVWVEPLKKAMKYLESAKDDERLWLVSDQPNVGTIGLLNCLRQEFGGHKIRCVFNANTNVDGIPEFKTNEPFYSEIISKDLVMNVFHDGQWGTFRHFGLPSPKDVATVRTPHAYLNFLTQGDLSSLTWIESPLKFYDPENAVNGLVMCHVYFAPLNFRDVMVATGKLPPDAIPGGLTTYEDCILGLEFAGREDGGKGRRVMGLVESKGLATTVMANPNLLWDVPDEWTLEQASTIPVAYVTAYFALIIRGKLRKGESVLIHSGSGGVGQAAISICLSMGCQVFTTVGSFKKREYLKKRFPQLRDANISNSRDILFEYEIKRETNGKGVDLVLNSLSEEKLQASVRCLAQSGRFLEIGKYDLSKNNPLRMGAFLRNITFHGVLLDALFDGDNRHRSTHQQLVELVNEGIKNGTVSPLRTTSFDSDHVEDAFRYMASGKHVGKVVIKVRQEEVEKRIRPVPVYILAKPKTLCHPDKTYVITGGLGGFGLELGNWLIERGCRRLVLTSRTGLRTGYQKLRLRRWKELGVDVRVSTRDVSRRDEAEFLIKESSISGAIGGIFNLAMVLRDAYMKNQTVDNFISVTNPKVKGTENLDRVTRELCSNLEWFVVFSSVACGRGNTGQNNYGFANSVMERICERRRTDGFAALAIQWGPIGDVGVIRETVGNENTVLGGFVQQKISSCLSTLDYFLQLARFSDSWEADEITKRFAVVSSLVPAHRTEVSSATGEGKDLLKSIGHILGSNDLAALNGDVTLGDMGIDSLMVVEVQQSLARDFEVHILPDVIRHLTLKTIKTIGNGLGKN